MALLSIVAVPLFCYRYVYYQTNLSNIYWAELPLYFVTERYQLYYIPYYILLLFIVALAVTYKADRQPGMKTKKVPYLLAQAAIAVALVVGVYTFWMKDENFHHELSMQHRISQLDWAGVLDEAGKRADTRHCDDA